MFEGVSGIEIIKLLLQFFGILGMGGIVSFCVIRKITKVEKIKDDKAQELILKEQQREDKITVLSCATKLLLRSEIYSMCDKIKKRGKMYLYEQEQLREILDTYTALNGNGTAHATVEKTLASYDVISSVDDDE